MRHDSPQGERIGFWFHLAFAGMYALAFAWHIKGAREHYRDMKRETPVEHIKRDTGQELYDRTLHDHERLPNRTWAEYNAHYTTLEDLIEEDRMASLHARRVDRNQ